MIFSTEPNITADQIQRIMCENFILPPMDTRAERIETEDSVTGLFHADFEDAAEAVLDALRENGVEIEMDAPECKECAASEDYEIFPRGAGLVLLVLGLAVLGAFMEIHGKLDTAYGFYIAAFLSGVKLSNVYSD